MQDKIRYAVVIEQGEPGCNYSAYVPDLPGCITTGASLAQVKRNLAEAVALHLHGMRQAGETIPAPSTVADFVEIDGDPDSWSEGVAEVNASRLRSTSGRSRPLPNE